MAVGHFWTGTAFTDKVKTNTDFLGWIFKYDYKNKRLWLQTKHDTSTPSLRVRQMPVMFILGFNERLC